MYPFYLNNLKQQINARLDHLMQERERVSQLLGTTLDASLKMLDQNAGQIKTLDLMLRTSLNGLKAQASLGGCEQDPAFTKLVEQFEQAQVKLLSLQGNRNKPGQLYNTQTPFKSAQNPDDPHQNTNPGQPEPNQ